MRAKGNRVLHFAVFDRAADVYLQRQLEEASDVAVWCMSQGDPLTPLRLQDRSRTGDVVDTIRRYAEGQLHGGEPPISLKNVDRLLLIGRNSLVRCLRDARDSSLRDYFSKKPETIGSIDIPMQCMLKGVCAQCLQWQIDPVTGLRTKAVFACSWQDQPVDIVDLDHLSQRQSQNRLQEHLANLWLDYLMGTRA
jgi:hypothetical protein